MQSSVGVGGTTTVLKAVRAFSPLPREEAPLGREGGRIGSGPVPRLKWSQKREGTRDGAYGSYLRPQDNIRAAYVRSNVERSYSYVGNRYTVFPTNSLGSGPKN